MLILKIINSSLKIKYIKHIMNEVKGHVPQQKYFRWYKLKLIKHQQQFERIL
jgi:hypothetical protein